MAMRSTHFPTAPGVRARRATRVAIAALVCAPLVATLTAQVPAGEAREPVSKVPEISYSRFVLKNGLTLLVHEDHKAPIAAINVWYHVGSKNERPGKTGFAHLFEHL